MPVRKATKEETAALFGRGLVIPSPRSVPKIGLDQLPPPTCEQDENDRRMAKQTPQEYQSMIKGLGDLARLRFDNTKPVQTRDSDGSTSHTSEIPVHKSQVEKFLPLELTYPNLAEKESFCSHVLCNLFPRVAPEVREMMRHGMVSDEYSDQLYNYLIDAIFNQASTVLQLRVDAGTNDSWDNWPIRINEYYGVFYISASELEDVCFFLSFDDALEHLSRMGLDLKVSNNSVD